LAGRAGNKKDVKNEGRSDYVHENKGQHDTLSDTKDDVSSQLHRNLHEEYAYFAPLEVGERCCTRGPDHAAFSFFG
jgi:hypothetical protein